MRDHLCLAPSYVLNGLESLELRVTKIERLIFAGAGMRGTEGSDLVHASKGGAVFFHTVCDAYSLWSSTSGPELGAISPVMASQSASAIRAQ